MIGTVKRKLFGALTAAAMTAVLFVTSFALAAEAGSCSVEGFSCSGSTVTVAWQSGTADAELHVRILKDADPSDENDRSECYTVSVGEKTLSLYDTEGKTVESGFSFENMPRYFIAEAWFTENGVSSEKVIWNRHNKLIEEAASYTPADSEGDRCVLMAGGYALMEEGALILRENGGMRLSREGNTCTIVNATEAAKGMKNGQALCFIGETDGKSEYTFLRCSGVSVSGDTVRFTGTAPKDDDGSIFDKFYVRGSQSWNDSYDTQGVLTLSFDYALTFRYEIVISFGEMSCEADFDYEFRKGAISLEALSYSAELPIRAIKFEFEEIFEVKAGLFFCVEASGKVNAEFETVGSTGVYVNGLSGGMRSDGPHFSFDPLTLDGTLFIGPKLGPELSVGAHHISASIGWEIKGGKFWYAKLHGGEGGDPATLSPTWHVCKAFKCICGDSKYILEGKGFVKAGKLSREFKPLEKEWDPAEFHYSWTFGDPEKEGDIKCPWYGTLVKVKVMSSTGAVLENVPVKYSPVPEKFEEKSAGVTDGSGMAYIWAASGPVDVTAVWTDADTGVTLYGSEALWMVKGTPQEVTLVIDTTSATVHFEKNTSGEVSGIPGDILFYPGERKETVLPEFEPRASGMVFAGWSEDSGARVPQYKPGESVMFRQDTTLYAVWRTDAPQDIWYLTYQTQGGTPVPTAQSAAMGGSITVTDTVPSKPGYIFNGWYLDREGSGNPLRAGDILRSDNEYLKGHLPYVTAYAVYRPATLLVLFHANASGTVTGMPETLTGLAETEVTIPPETPAVSGRRFLGWAKNKDAAAREYKPGDSVTLGVEDLDLYAVWGLVNDNYRIRYDANGGTGAPLVQTGTVGVPVRIAEKTPVRERYAFLGWAADAASEMPEYLPGDTYDRDTDVTLYAVWQYKPVTAYTITYDANGGKGAPGTQFGTYGGTVTLSLHKPTRTAHTFTGWSVKGGMAGVVLEPGARVGFDGDVTLVAVWAPDYKIIRGANGTWTRKQGGSFRLDCNGALDEFERLVIDGETVDAANYRLSEGSTIVKLKESWLKTLKNGKHTVFFVYDDGRTETADFFIRADEPVPETGDGNRPLFFAGLMTLSAAGFIFTLKKRRG